MGKNERKPCEKIALLLSQSLKNFENQQATHRQAGKCKFTFWSNIVAFDTQNSFIENNADFAR